MKKWFSVVLFSSALAVCAVSVLAAAKNNEPTFVDAIVMDGGTGKPVPNAVVYYIAPDGRINATPPKSAIRTDNEGRCRLAQINDMRAFYLAVADGYSYGVGRSKQDDPRLTFTLWPELVLKGKVVDELGRRVPGALVKMTAYFGTSIGGSTPDLNNNSYILGVVGKQRFDVVSDQDGNFTIEHLPDPSPFDQANVHLETSKNGHANMNRLLFAVNRLKGRNDFIREIRLLCPNASMLQGKLIYPRDLKLSSKRFSLLARYNDQQNYEFCYYGCNVGPGGAYKIENVPAGNIDLQISQLDSKWEVMADPECGTPCLRDIAMQTGETKNMDITIKEGALISGTVIDAETGKPFFTKLDVRHSGYFDEHYISSCISDEEGKFTVRVPAGEAKIGLSMQVARSVSQAAGVSVTVADGETKSDVVIKIPN